jgi:F0F1-type ATP synthase membrane subunit b/b'
LEAAQIQAQEAVNIARGNAAEIINRANEQATQIRLEAKHHASKTIQKKLIETQAAIALEKVKAESDLDQSVADLAECCANKLLSGTKDPSDS